MKRILGAVLGAAIALLCQSPARAIDLNVVVIASCGTVPTTLPAGTGYSIFTDQNGNLCMNGSVTVTPSGNTAVIGPTADGSPATTPPVLIGGTSDGTATGTVDVWKVTAAGVGYVNNAPSAASDAGLTPVTTSALAANQIVKASAGNLYSFEVSADSTLSAAAWWVMIYNATSAPVDGAVTPLKCYAMPLGVTNYAAAFPVPIAFSTGITIGVSTTGCFTKTASTHAFISGDAQ
jgi:hypothetical protein